MIMCIKNGQRINETDVMFMNNRQQLHIESASENDAGRYSCVAENKPGRAEKDLVVAVLKPPKMEDQHRVLELAENEALTLTCPINDPSVDIQWTKNNAPITTSNNLQLSTSGLKLHLMHGQLTDAGRYACRAWNDAGEATAYMDVVVLVPARINEPAFRTIESVLNQTVSMECKATGIPAPNNVWSFDGRTIFPSDKIQILNNGTVLLLQEVQVSQEGRYSCISTNKVGKAEADIFLHVTAPPRIVTPADELKVIQGQGQTIRCEVSGTPPPKVEWFKNGQKFNSAMTQSSNNLHYIHIREAQVGDAGRYTCIATNRAGEHRITTQLHVLVPPMIIEGERVVQVKENTALTLECVATGNPKPMIVWKRDGRPLETIGSYYMIASSKASDAGRYTCEARNEAGKASADFEVDIFIKPRFRDLKPNVRVRNGDRTRLECKVDGYPEPSITWMRGGRPIEDTKNIILSPRGETMMILKSRRADSGSYSCVAKNSAGEAEASFTVIVLIAPHIEEQIDQNPRVVQGNDVVLQCPVQGNPKPKIKWLYEGDPIKSDRIILSGETNLMIRSSQQYDSGRYTCLAENEAGILNTNYELEIIGPPKFHHRGEAVYEVVLGKTVTMDCNVEAEPKPEIHWYRGDSPVYLSENIHISPDSQQITIRGVKMSDGGKYRCKAQNEAGSADIDLTLKVLVPPSIDTSNIIGNPLAVSGKSIYLECPVTGIPQPSVIWYKNERPITIDDDRLFIEQNNQTLGIKKVKVSDQGQYLCVAENKGGRVEQIFNLEVLVPPVMEIIEPQMHTKREKDTITLFCPVKHMRGSTTPTEILWYKDGRPIDGNSLPNIEITYEGQRLQIVRTSLSDAGNYSCVALNRAGEASVDFYVEILCMHLDSEYCRNLENKHIESIKSFNIQGEEDNVRTLIEHKDQIFVPQQVDNYNSKVDDSNYKFYKDYFSNYIFPHTASEISDTVSNSERYTIYPYSHAITSGLLSTKKPQRLHFETYQTNQNSSIIYYSVKNHWNISVKASSYTNNLTTWMKPNINTANIGQLGKYLESEWIHNGNYDKVHYNDGINTLQTQDVRMNFNKQNSEVDHLTSWSQTAQKSSRIDKPNVNFLMKNCCQNDHLNAQQENAYNHHHKIQRWQNILDSHEINPLSAGTHSSKTIQYKSEDDLLHSYADHDQNHNYKFQYGNGQYHFKEWGKIMDSSGIDQPSAGTKLSETIRRKNHNNWMHFNTEHIFGQHNRHHHHYRNHRHRHDSSWDGKKLHFQRQWQPWDPDYSDKPWTSWYNYQE